MASRQSETPSLEVLELRAEVEWLTRAREDVYAERNAVVLAFAHLAGMCGWPVGKATDPGEPDWPVLLIDTPAGQVSWHFKGDALERMPDYPGEWDGHDTPEKYARLRTLIGMTHAMPEDGFDGQHYEIDEAALTQSDASERGGDDAF